MRDTYHVWIENVGWDKNITAEELAASTPDDIRLFIFPVEAERVLDDLRARNGRLCAQVVSQRVRLNGEPERYANGYAIAIWDFDKEVAAYLRRDGEFRAYQEMYAKEQTV